MLNKKIKQARLKAGLSQEELGKKVGHTKSNVSKWESGSAIPDINTIKSIAHSLNVSVSYLIDDKEEVESKKSVEIFKWNKANFDKYPRLKIKQIPNKSLVYINWSLLFIIITFIIIGFSIIIISIFTLETNSPAIKRNSIVGGVLIIISTILLPIKIIFISKRASIAYRFNVRVKVYSDNIQIIKTTDNKTEYISLKDISDIQSLSEKFGRFTLILKVRDANILKLFDVDKSVLNHFNTIKRGGI